MPSCGPSPSLAPLPLGLRLCRRVWWHTVGLPWCCAGAMCGDGGTVTPPNPHALACTVCASLSASNAVLCGLLTQQRCTLPGDWPPPQVWAVRDSVSELALGKPAMVLSKPLFYGLTYSLTVLAWVLAVVIPSVWFLVGAGRVQSVCRSWFLWGGCSLSVAPGGCRVRGRRRAGPRTRHLGRARPRVWPVGRAMLGFELFEMHWHVAARTGGWVSQPLAEEACCLPWLSLSFLRSQCGLHRAAGGVNRASAD